VAATVRKKPEERYTHVVADEVNFPPPSGQVDYAAIAASWLLSSNPMGHS
jgi:hypothetical protein